MFIYHIVLPETWDEQKSKDHYEHLSRHNEGFIHCSFRDQLAAVLDRYYSGVERVLILHVDADLLSAKLVIESSTGGELYPHIYGPLNRNAVMEVEERELRN
jgi:uncharacterized protein (DUF952 family)